MAISIFKQLTALILIAFTATSLAKGNEKAGEQKAATCAACHGEGGHSIVPTFPKLAGQNTKYLERQLRDFKSGKRVDPVMSSMAEALNEEDIADLAAYYAAQTPVTEASDPNPLGHNLFVAGKISSGLPACTGCHGPAGAGNPDAGFPSLKGQHAAYLEKTLTDYHSGARANDPNAVMRQIAGKLTEAEISALAEHLSTLK